MKTSILSLLCALTLSSCACLAQTSDFPGASDLPDLARPAGSFIVGAMRVDNDEYAIPTGTIERNAAAPAKSLPITGAIDTLAYSGPTTASSFSTYNALATQLKSAGYTELWSCARTTCGSAYTLINYLAQPTINSTHQGDWGHYMIDSLYAANDDTRYAAFRKDDHYILIAASLSAGHRSGAFVIRIAPSETPSVLQSPQPSAAASAADPAPQPSPQSLRSRARGWLNKAVPQ